MAKTTDRFPPPPNADSILFVKGEAALAADAKAFIESVAPQSDLPPGHKAALKEGRIRRRADIATERDEATPADKRIEFRPTPFTDPDPAGIEPRDWLYAKHYIRKYVVADVAPTGTIKTTNALVEAIAMASAVNLLRIDEGQMPPRPLKVWYWSGEDPKEEIDRRLAAAIKLYTEGERDDLLSVTALEPEQRALLKTNLFTDTGRDVPIKIAVESNGALKIAEPVIAELIRAITTYKIDVLIIDPFVDSHGVGENDNSRIEAVIAAWREVAERANCCICLVHHTRKSGRGASKESDADDARGAGAFGAAVRSIRVFNVMTEDEASANGVAADQRWRFIRTRDDKPNMARRDQLSAWRYIESVKLGNARPPAVGETRGREEDDVGVVLPWWPAIKSEAQSKADKGRILDVVLKLIDAGKRITRTQGGDYAVAALAPLLRRDYDIRATVDEIKAVILEATEDRTAKGGAKPAIYYFEDRKRGNAGYRRVGQ